MNRPRRARVAATFALFLGGLGHLYAGRARRALGFFLLDVVFGMAAVQVFMRVPGPLWSVALFVGLRLAAATDAARTARHSVRRRFNRWYVYPVAFAALGWAHLWIVLHAGVGMYRVPTGAMSPTIVPGDRILVDELAWHSGSPRRYDVAVFRFPLNRNRNYVKRIVGLPGEWLLVADGDIWVSRDRGGSWQIMRKPDLMWPYYPDERFRGRNCWRGDDGWTVDEEEGRFTVDADTETRSLTFARKVVPYDDCDVHGYAAEPYVGDVRVSFRVAVERAGTLVVGIRERDRLHRLQLGASESFAEIGGAERLPLDVRLGPGERVVSFANVDDTLVVVLDGETSTFAFPDTPSAPPAPEDGIHAPKRGGPISISATSTKALLTDLRIDRDLHYFERTGRGRSGWSGIWDIPEDCYLMFGDNTMSSSDSREWQVTRVVLADGTVIAWVPGNQEGSLNPYMDEDVDGVVTIGADVDGRRRSYRIDAVAEEAEAVPWPFATRDDLIGRARVTLFSEDLRTGEARWERWGIVIR